MEIKELLELLNGGGNVAVCVCALFIYRAAERLARIEKALDRYMSEKLNEQADYFSRDGKGAYRTENRFGP